MERFFPSKKLILTGNPVRQNLNTGTKEGAIEYFNKTFGAEFTTDRKTLLIIGGSLGARTINQSIIAHLPELINSGIQVIWQTGKYYFEECKQALNSQLSTLNTQHSTIICTDFISQMPDAYALADLVISRAGASSISELCLLGKPSILVPSPNVAEDHQTHNAMALVNKQAAVLVKDVEAHEKMVQTALQLIQNQKILQDLQTNILTLSLPDSAKLIAQEVITLAKQ
jgi:UDP-N-acetylglucosamine--N-acetylmuramyl-(pentapeptide) pyrophosphoryl-undecaprenol N-acetylglucosamine transferase